MVPVLPYDSVTQVVAVGHRLVYTTLPTTTAVATGETAVYPSSNQGGLFVFGIKGSNLPPKNGDTYTVRPLKLRKLLRIMGNAGDATGLSLYIGPIGSMVLVETVVVSGDFWWEPEHWLLSGEAIGLTDSGGGILQARTVTVSCAIASVLSSEG